MIASLVLVMASAWAADPPTPSASEPTTEAPVEAPAPDAGVEAEAPVAAPPVIGPKPPDAGPSQADEEAASRILGMVGSTYRAGDHRAARDFLETLRTRYPGTQAQLMSREVESMLALIDRPVPADWKSSVEQWFTPKAGLNLEKGLVVVLFWEVWCPHCRREMPEWQTRFEAFEKEGLQLAGFTSLSQGATVEEVEAFIRTHDLTFPIGKEDGNLSLASAVRSIPAAVVYQDGKVIFRGPPPFITDALLSEWLRDDGATEGK